MPRDSALASSGTYIKNEIMFCDIVALQADPLTIPEFKRVSSNLQQDLSEPTKLMITHNSNSTFIVPPNQSQGYFFKSRLFPAKRSVTHRVYEFKCVFQELQTFT
jgi:hypothetical protein